MLGVQRVFEKQSPCKTGIPGTVALEGAMGGGYSGDGELEAVVLKGHLT